MALDPQLLGDSPLIEEAMTAAGFILNPTSNQPGAWQTAAGIPVDLMVPEKLAGPGSKTVRGGARLPPHDKRAMRRATGLEAAIIDNSIETVTALDPADTRTFDVKVAGPAALIVAKIHKLTERLDHPDRLNDKDAHDIYRILRTVDTAELARCFRAIMRDPISQDVTRAAIAGIQVHLAAGAGSTVALMAGRAEEGIGEPAAAGSPDTPSSTSTSPTHTYIAAGIDVHNAACSVATGQRSEAFYAGRRALQPRESYLGRSGRKRISDGGTRGAVVEIKNVHRLGHTRQIHDAADFARRTNGQLHIVVRRSTRDLGAAPACNQLGAVAPSGDGVAPISSRPHARH
ncbi:MAG: putative toxin [Tetrasphaera sp.]